MKITVGRGIQIIALILHSSLGAARVEINPDDIMPLRHSKPPMKNMDSFLQVFEKLMQTFPSFKSKVYMRLHKYIDPNGSEMSSNPSTYFKTGMNSVPEPDEIVQRFQSIANAANMLKQERRSLIGKVERYVDQMYLDEKELLRMAEGYVSDMRDLVKQHAAETDPLVESSIVVKFKAKEKIIVKSIAAINRIRRWEVQIEKSLNSPLLKENLTPDE
ncbi:hypothetical protein NEAUS03_1623 [Nematocida ausubeli]|nr:hypothetical protein NEAUS03_1623 [Nematocida ausubeli]